MIEVVKVAATVALAMMVVEVAVEGEAVVMTASTVVEASTAATVVGVSDGNHCGAGGSGDGTTTMVSTGCGSGPTMVDSRCRWWQSMVVGVQWWLGGGGMWWTFVSYH